MGEKNTVKTNEDRLHAEIAKGLKAADQGQLLDHADIRVSWETKRKAQAGNPEKD